jgi:arylsulfatase A-like enzyme
VGGETVIAIMSDHLFMEGEVTEMLEKGTRRPFFFLIDPGRPAGTVPGPFTHFDVAPTLLEAAGLPGARFAFGHSLLAHDRGLAIARNLTAEDFAPFTIEALTEVAWRR